MGSGDAALTAFIARLRSCRDLAKEVAKEAAPLVANAIKKTAAAGTDANGKPWEPKKDGGRALVHAADAVSAKALGTVVQLQLKGVEVIHHFGTKGGKIPARPILPQGGSEIPKAVGDAIKAAAKRVFDRTLKS